MIPPQDCQHGVMGTKHDLQRLTDTLEALMQGQSQQQQRGAQLQQQLATWTEHLTGLAQHVAAMTTHLRQQWVLVGLLVGLTLGLCGGMGWQLWHPPAMEYVRALGALDTVVVQQWSSLPKPAQDALSATYTQLGLEPKSPLSPTTEPAVLNLQAQVEAQRQKVQAEQQQLEEERHLYKEYQQLQAEQERLRQEREKLQKGSAPQGTQGALGVDAPPPAPPPPARKSGGSASAPTTVTVELSSPTPDVTFRPQQRFPAIPGKKVRIAAAKQGYLTATKTILVAEHDMTEELGPLQPQAEGEQGERERRKHQAEETKRQRREAEQAAGEHRRQAEETERQRREAEEAEQRQRETRLVAQGMKFIVKRRMLCLTTTERLVTGTVTLTGASSLSCDDAKRSLLAEDEEKNACVPRWPDTKEGEKHWIGTASCPAP